MEQDRNTKHASITTSLIHGLIKNEIAAFCQEAGQPSYRADQIWNWLYVKNATDWAQMKNLPAALRTQLAERFSLDSATEARIEGESGGTRKILLGLRDGERVEEVLIPADNRRTVCISSQAGCRFHCSFCASGQSGFRRNLDAGEIVGQVLLAWRGFGDKPTHVVVMGVGEPFDNYDAVLKAVRIINDQEGLCLGARRITISTAGVIPGIERLAEEGLQVELSVSLHAPSDSLRSELMPINRQYPLPRSAHRLRGLFQEDKTSDHLRVHLDRKRQRSAVARPRTGPPARLPSLPGELHPAEPRQRVCRRAVLPVRGGRVHPGPGQGRHQCHLEGIAGNIGQCRLRPTEKHP